MKKIMLGILILVPIIIMTTVAAVSTFVTTRAHIAVDHISFDKESVILEFGEDFYELSDMLTVTVLPERASDKSYVWSMDRPVCFDQDYESLWQQGLAPAPASLVDDSGNAVSENESGRIRILSHCYFYVYVQAEQMSAKCLVMTSNTDVQSLRILGINTMAVGEVQLLNVAPMPVDAIINDTIWTSSDPSIATIDINGVIKAVSAGITTVKASAKRFSDDEYVDSPEFEIVVTPSAFPYGTQVYVSQREIPLSALGLSVDNLDEDFFVNARYNEDASAIIINEGASYATIYVGEADGKTITISLCETDDIKFVNSEIYEFKENTNENFVLAVGNNLKLSVCFADILAQTLPENVVFTSNRPSVATVSEDGLVSGISSGKVVITAVYNDNGQEKRADITLAVETKVANLILGITNETIKKEGGLAREFVVASRTINPITGAYENARFEIPFAIPTLPESEDDRKVLFSAFDFSALILVDGVWTETDLVYFEDNVAVFDSTVIEGIQNIKIRVKAKYPMYQTSASYTVKEFEIKVLDGVNVGTEEEFRRACADRYSIALYNTFKLKNQHTGNSGTLVTFYGDLYGNNFMIYSSSNEMRSRNFKMLRSVGYSAVVSNLRLRINDDMPEEIKSGDESMGKLVGMGIDFQGSSSRLGEPSQNTKPTLQFSIIENATMCVELYNADILIEGCIMRNCLEMAVWGATRATGGVRFNFETGNTEEMNGGIRYNNVTVKNCVMSNMLGTAFSWQYQGYTSESGFDYNRAIQEEKNSTFSIVGFLDSYNWQQLNVLSIVSKSNPDLEEEYVAMLEIVNTLLRNELETNSNFAKFRAVYDGLQYFHLGGLCIGLTEASMLNILADNDSRTIRKDDNRWSYISVDDFKNGALDILKNLPYTEIWSYLNTSSITPGLTYSINERLIDKLHGIGVQYPEGTPEYEAAMNAQ